MLVTRYVLWNHDLKVWLRQEDGFITGVREKAHRFEFMATAELARLSLADPEWWEVKPVAFDTARGRIVDGEGRAV